MRAGILQTLSNESVALLGFRQSFRPSPTPHFWEQLELSAIRLLLGLLGIFLGGITLYVVTSREPSYQGKQLSSCPQNLCPFSRPFDMM